MDLAGIAGWVLVAAAAACALRARHAGQNTAAAKIDGAGDDPVGIRREEGEAWCGAIEATSESTAFLFDAAMSLVATGPGALRDGAQAEAGAHVIDVAPAEHAAEFIDAAAAARRGEKRSWEIAWLGRRCVATAIPVYRGCFLIRIREGRL